MPPSTHAAGIILDSVALETASEGLAAAKAAHIPIVSMYQPATDASESAAVKGFVVPNSMDQAQAMLGPLLENVGCHGQIGYLYGSVFALQLQMLQDAKVVISQLCRGVSDCGMKPYSFDLDNYTTTAGPAGVALAHTTPGLSGVFILGDFIAAYLVPAFHTADIKIPIATTGGSELDLLTNPGTPVLADVAIPSYQFVGWEALDSLLHLMLGGTAPAQNQIFAQSLLRGKYVKGAPVMPTLSNYQQLFKTAWKVG